MRSLFKAGFVAALIQLVAICATTIVAILSARRDTAPSVAGDADIGSSGVFAFLPWAYVLIAVGVALSANRFVDLTAARIRHASRAMHPAAPASAAETLQGRLWLAAIGCAILAVNPPPDLVSAICRHLGHAGTAPMVWSGLISIGAASFGANAQAAGKSFDTDG